MPDPLYPVETLGADEDDGTMPENVAELEKAVVGHRIVSAEKEYGEFVLTLDTGARVKLRNTSDCCAYTDLDAFLVHPDKVDHAITGVGTTEGRLLDQLEALHMEFEDAVGIRIINPPQMPVISLVSRTPVHDLPMEAGQWDL